MTAPAAESTQIRLVTPWLTVPEAARYARCGRNAVYDACRTGAVKARQTGRGGTWVIHTDELDVWLAFISEHLPGVTPPTMRAIVPPSLESEI